MSHLTNNSRFQTYLDDARKKHDLIAFLNRTNLWQSVEVAVNKFVQDITKNGEDFRMAPVIVRIKFDMTQLLIEPFLQYLAEEPHAFDDLLNQSIHMVMSTYLQKREVNIEIRLAQIYVLKECVNLPTNRDYDLFGATNVVRKGLVNFIGILTGYSDLRKSIRHSVWYCPSQCPVNEITGEVSKPMRCAECSIELLEYSKYRDMSDFILLTLLPSAAVQSGRLNGHKICRALRVRVNDEMTQLDLVLGEEYRICGIYDGCRQEFVAWCVTKVR